MGWMGIGGTFLVCLHGMYSTCRSPGRDTHAVYKYSAEHERRRDWTKGHPETGMTDDRQRRRIEVGGGYGIITDDIAATQVTGEGT